MRELEGKVAIVTGGGSGIGRAIALRFARARARVAVVDIVEGAAAETVREIAACDAGKGEGAGGAGGAAAAVPCDVSRQLDVQRAFQAVLSRFDTLDILVNSAGIAHVGNVEQTSEDDFDRLYAVHVKGVYNCMKAALPALKHRGEAILNIATAPATLGIVDRSPC